MLLDKLIDTLASNAMDVRNVKPGVEIMVSDLGNEGLLVIIDVVGNTYESRIVGNDVETRKRRTAVSDSG